MIRKTTSRVFDSNHRYYYDKNNQKHAVNLEDIDDNDQTIFYKEFPINNPLDLGLKIEGKKKVNFNKRLIVTYSNKYKTFLSHKRDEQIIRAEYLTRNGELADIKNN